MGDPDAAAHVLGKLLTAFGPERILWGTDSIWYGSPQDQIAAFRAFEITPAFQEQFGYPALTADVKQRIMSANAAELFGITVPAPACEPGARASGFGAPTAPSGRWPGVTSWRRSCASTPGSPPPSRERQASRPRITAASRDRAILPPARPARAEAAPPSALRAAVDDVRAIDSTPRPKPVRNQRKAPGRRRPGRRRRSVEGWTAAGRRGYRRTVTAHPSRSRTRRCASCASGRRAPGTRGRSRWHR